MSRWVIGYPVVELPGSRRTGEGLPLVASRTFDSKIVSCVRCPVNQLLGPAATAR
ncbi:MAG TPA: hypothetical protein VFH02_14085 [Jiangellaceae bacterium]|nr:hypothetical protein [Jiangellaceae bacterium]